MCVQEEKRLALVEYERERRQQHAAAAGPAPTGDRQSQRAARQERRWRQRVITIYGNDLSTEIEQQEQQQLQEQQEQLAELCTQVGQVASHILLQFASVPAGCQLTQLRVCRMQVLFVPSFGITCLLHLQAVCPEARSQLLLAALQLMDAQAAAASATKLQQQMQACHQAALQAAQQELDEQQEALKLQLEQQQLAHRRELRSLQQKLANMEARMEVQHKVGRCKGRDLIIQQSLMLLFTYAVHYKCRP